MGSEGFAGGLSGEAPTFGRVDGWGALFFPRGLDNLGP